MQDTSLTLTIAMLECYHLQIKKERSPLSSCRTCDCYWWRWAFFKATMFIMEFSGR